MVLHFDRGSLHVFEVIDRCSNSKASGVRNPMTVDDIRNEHLKLIANWLNTLAAAIITAGTFVPAAQFIFDVLPQGTDNGLLVGIGAVCVVFGFAVHLAGHVFVGGLR
jgi:amino acid transporter